MGIAYRRALRALRDERHRSIFDGEAGHEEPGSDEGEAALMQDWIAKGLRELPEEQRLTLELAYFMGHSCEEIATISGCPVGTVKARMFHAREKLRRALPSLGGNPAAGST
jgi:RNA polymerase sigma-70 factor (ECF subfamily)